MQHQDALPSRSPTQHSIGKAPTTCSSKQVPSRLVFDAPRIADWCEKRIDHFAGWGVEPRGVGLEREDALVAGVVYTHFTGSDVMASIVIDGRISKQFLYTIFWNPFVAWGCRHITCCIEEWNVKSVSLCSNMGFIEEGRRREAAYDGSDVIMMGLLKRECRFL